MRIVFVCDGNICRSAFAAALLRRALGPGVVAIDSCGLVAQLGDTPNRRTVRMAAEHDIDLSTHDARPFAAVDLAGADLVVVVVERQRRVLCEAGLLARRIRLLTSFGAEPAYDIDDPGELQPETWDGYRRVGNEIANAVAELADWLVRERRVSG